MCERQVLEQLNKIDLTEGAISDVVSLMLMSNEGKAQPGAEVLHRLSNVLRSELDELAQMHGLNN